MKLNDSLVEINLIPFERSSISGCRLSNYIRQEATFLFIIRMGMNLNSSKKENGEIMNKRFQSSGKVLRSNKLQKCEHSVFKPVIHGPVELIFILSKSVFSSVNLLPANCKMKRNTHTNTHAHCHKNSGFNLNL